MVQTKNWKGKDIEKEEVDNALKKATYLIEKRLNSDCNAVDYLAAHKANKEFKNENGLTNEQILDISLEISRNEDTLYRFCHKELDSHDSTWSMYCFKLQLELSEDIPEEVLFKFRFRTTKDGEQIFIMSLHYPDMSKEPWEYIWSRE
jgi:hypothetical protein